MIVLVSDSFIRSYPKDYICALHFNMYSDGIQMDNGSVHSAILESCIKTTSDKCTLAEIE